MPALKVIGIGDNVVDDYVHTRTLYPGGNALNVAVYASMLGCESAYLGVFGSDEAAEHVRSTLDELGVDTSRCRRADGPNGRAELTIENGERVFIGSNEGGVAKQVSMAFVLDDPDYLQQFSLAHTSAYSYIDPCLPRLRAMVPVLSYDFSDDFDPDEALATCRHVDIGFFSCAGQPESVTRDLLHDAVAGGCRLAAATRGARDALLFDGTDWFRQPPADVEPTDTLGAGDAFIAGFLVSWLDGCSSGSRRTLIERSLHKAAAFASETCRVEGAFGYGLGY